MELLLAWQKCSSSVFCFLPTCLHSLLSILRSLGQEFRLPIKRTQCWMYMPRSIRESQLILSQQGVCSFQQQTRTLTPCLRSVILTPGLWRWLTEWQAHQSKRDPRDYFLPTDTQSRHPLQHLWQVVRQLIQHCQCTHILCSEANAGEKNVCVTLTDHWQTQKMDLKHTLPPFRTTSLLLKVTFTKVWSTDLCE